MDKYYIKANRIFTKWRKWAWTGTFVIAAGGLFEPLLGLLVLGIIVGLMVMSFLRGRYWCGNICTHGSFYDLILIKFSRNTKIPKFLRSKIMVIFFLAFFMFNMGRGMISAVDAATYLELLRGIGAVFVNTYWMVIAVSVLFGLIFTSRTWCYFCPMGTFQRLAYKLGKVLGTSKKTDVKVSVKDKQLCRSCAKCARVCPMQLQPYLEFDDNNQFGSDSCIKCKTCIVHCPVGVLGLWGEGEAVSPVTKL